MLELQKNMMFINNNNNFNKDKNIIPIYERMIKLFLKNVKILKDNKL